MLKNWRLNSVPDAVLVKKTVSGNPDTFSELYDRYYERIFNYLYRMLGGDRDKAQDFLQEAFLKALNNINRYDASIKFSTWIFTIAHNLCKNEYRRLSNRQTESTNDINLLLKEDHINPMDELIQNEFRSQVFRLIDQIDKEQRSVFILRFQEGLSIREIAEVLDCAEGTVKSRLHYAVKKISVHLKEHNPNYNEV